MSYFKKFSDFCSGFCAFMALIYLFRQFMAFDLKDEEAGMLDKVKAFFSRVTELDNHLLLWLAMFFVLSVVVGRVAARFPYISLVATLPPMMLTIDLIKAEYIKEYPMLYVLLAAIAIVGAIFECVRMDKEDGKRRSALGGNLVSLFAALYCLLIWRRATTLVVEDTMQLNHFDFAIYTQTPNMDTKIFLIFAVIFAVTVLISVLLSDIYFIHGILSLPVAIALIYLWGAGKLTVHPELLVTLGVCNFVARAIPALCARAGKLTQTTSAPSSVPSEPEQRLEEDTEEI